MDSRRGHDTKTRKTSFSCHHHVRSLSSAPSPAYRPATKTHTDQPPTCNTTPAQHTATHPASAARRQLDTTQTPRCVYLPLPTLSPHVEAICSNSEFIREYCPRTCSCMSARTCDTVGWVPPRTCRLVEGYWPFGSKNNLHFLITSNPLGRPGRLRQVRNIFTTHTYITTPHIST